MRRCSCVLLLTTILAAGCSRASPLVPIAGRVTLEDKPVPNMIVNFTPLGETAGNGALGCTNDEGKYTLLDARGEAGAYIGEYKVSFYPALSRNKQVDPALDVISVPSKAGLPSIYMDPNLTPLRANVPKGGGTIDLVMTRTGSGAPAKPAPAAARYVWHARLLRCLPLSAFWYFRSEVSILIGMSEVTRILSQIDQGDPQAAEKLLPLVYDELRKLAAAKLAQEKPGQTLQATALVHDAYIRLVDSEKAQHWNSRGHFFAAAAGAMRRILIDQAKRKGRIKRGGGLRRVNLEQADAVCAIDPADLLDLDEALERLSAEHGQAAEIAKLRLFAGLSVEQAAHAMGISRSTAFDGWAYARAWLTCELSLPRQ